MRRNIMTAVLYTVLGTIVLGIGYPYAVTGIAQVLFRE